MVATTVNVRLGKVNTALRIMEGLSGQLTPSLTGSVLVINKVQSVLNELDLNRGNASDSMLCKNAPAELHTQYEQSLRFTRVYLDALVKAASMKEFSTQAVTVEKTNILKDMKDNLSQAHSYLYKLKMFEETAVARAA